MFAYAIKQTVFILGPEFEIDESRSKKTTFAGTEKTAGPCSHTIRE